MLTLTLRQVAEQLQELVNRCAEIADRAKEQNDPQEQAFFNGCARGYAMSARILSVRAAQLEKEQHAEWDASRFDFDAVEAKTH